MSTNIDSWFSYCVVNKIQFRLNLYFELFDLEIMYEFDDVI